MQDSYIGSTSASQAERRGSTPVSCFLLCNIRISAGDAVILLFPCLCETATAARAVKTWHRLYYWRIIYAETDNIKEKENGFKNGIADTLSLLKTVVITFLLMLLLTNCIIANAVVPTGSMENTIEPGNRIIGMRFLKNYERGDIVIFPDPDGSGHYLIKRIIGMPGDRLSFERDGDTEFCQRLHQWR